ncbi:hypothetical protein [Agrococcus sp. Marseille-Q4369]|uniref:HNH endonuclease n=1 Tax=Agrococcus sp. Marseille-Q4369 TaxID=2810513 RepID=UPI001B8D9CCB|nr:hypothetical protein [Agrococcus sp. Marseille-Q4369]QUW18881.1 hypothetical protein JSQ78_00400 [Agrococcus sp. Marseille-Q4369]
MAWDTSDRRSRLPEDWDDLRKQVKRRAGGRCEAKRHAPHCNGIGTDCDHVRPGDDHGLGNLQWLSRPCHDAKTRADNARQNAERAALRRRPTENHPGRIT